MAWNEVSQSRATQWLNSGKIPACRCRAGVFVLDQCLAALPTVPLAEGPLQIQVGPVFACAVVSCSHCHEMRFYSAQGLGLVE